MVFVFEFVEAQGQLGSLVQRYARSESQELGSLLLALVRTCSDFKQMHLLKNTYYRITCMYIMYIYREKHHPKRYWYLECIDNLVFFAS